MSNVLVYVANLRIESRPFPPSLPVFLFSPLDEENIRRLGQRNLSSKHESMSFPNSSDTGLALIMKSLVHCMKVTVFAFKLNWDQLVP